MTIFVNQNCKVYEHTVHTKWLLCYQASSFSCLGRSTSYDWRAKATKLPPLSTIFSVGNLWGFSFHTLIEFDHYREDSIKNSERRRRGKSQENDCSSQDITESKCSSGTRKLLVVYHQQNCVPGVLCEWLTIYRLRTLQTCIHCTLVHGSCQLGELLHSLDSTAHTRKLTTGWCSMYRIF